MLPDVTWDVVFTPRDGFPEKESYQYTRLEDAENHYGLFISDDSEELYSSIALLEYNWSTKTETVLKRMDFPNRDAG